MEQEIKLLIDHVSQIDQEIGSCAEIIKNLQSSINSLYGQQDKKAKEKQDTLIKLQGLIKEGTVVYNNKSYSLRSITVLHEDEENDRKELYLKSENLYDLDAATPESKKQTVDSTVAD